jgi:hypothetical protein
MTSERLNVHASGDTIEVLAGPDVAAVTDTQGNHYVQDGAVWRAYCPHALTAADQIVVHRETLTIPPEAITAFMAAMRDVPGWPPYLARAADYADSAALQAADRDADEQNEAVARRALEAAAPLIAAAERDRIGQLLSIFTEELRAEGHFHWADRIAGLADRLAGG